MSRKDNQPDEKHPISEKNKKPSKEDVSSVSASFMLISQIVGSALLSIAYIFSRVGLVLMFFILPLSFAIALLLILPVIEGCYLTRSYSYRALTQKVIGPKFAYILDAMLIILYFGFLTSYIIIASQSFIGILQSFLPSFDSYKWIPYVVKTGVAFLIILPLSLLKSTKLLSAIASVSIFFAMAMAITIPVYYFISLGRNGQVCPRFPSTRPDNGNAIEGFFRPAVPWWPSSSKGLGLDSLPMGFLFFFGYIPLLQGNYTSQLAVPAMLGIISGPMYLRMRILKISITIAFIFCTMLYVFTGVFGALLFGKSIFPNLLSSFDVCADYWITSIKAMYGLVVCITYPIALFPLKLSIIAYTKVDRESDPKRWYGLFAAFTLVFLIPGVGITLVYENIAAIFGLVGSLCGGVIYFGVPIWVYYKLPFLRIKYPQDINKEFSDAAGNTGIIRTEAIGTSVLALLLPGSANEAISRARVLSVTDTTSVSSVKVRSKSMENPVLSIRSLIGFVRGKSFSAARPSLPVPQTLSMPPMPEVPGPSSFMVTVENFRSRTTSVFNAKPTLTRVFSRRDAKSQQSETLSLTQDSVRISELDRIGSVESTEQATCTTEDVTDVIPAVPEVCRMEIGAICGTVNTELERAKMTPCRRAVAWSAIVLFSLICIEGIFVNTTDFVGKLD